PARASGRPEAEAGGGGGRGPAPGGRDKRGKEGGGGGEKGRGRGPSRKSAPPPRQAEGGKPRGGRPPAPRGPGGGGGGGGAVGVLGGARASLGARPSWRDSRAGQRGSRFRRTLLEPAPEDHLLGGGTLGHHAAQHFLGHRDLARAGQGMSIGSGDLMLFRFA